MAGLLKDGELVTKKAYDVMTPTAQGFVQYMEGDWPGSELKDLTNPYPENSERYHEWNHGQALGAQQAQDSEE